ncbi:unnamed protein product [Aphanomyces euteiches]
MEEYRSLVEEVVVDAIDHRELWIDDARHDNSGWKLTVNKRNMQVFRKKTQSVPHDATSSSLFTFLTVGYLSTTIEDLHTSLYAATSKDDQILHSLLLDKEFLTSQVLAVLDDIALPSLDPDLPDFLGIKYIKLRMPGSRLGVNPRESVYVEYLTLREDNILVKVVHSIDNFLPPHTDGGVIHRATLRDVWLFVPAPNGKIQVVARTFHDMKGSAPKYFSDQSALSFWRVYDKLTSMSYVRRLLAMPHGALRGSLSSLTQSQPITRGSIRRAVSQTRTHCQCCKRKFTLFHSKRFMCTHCSAVVCSNCHVPINYSVQKSVHPIPHDKVHVAAMESHKDLVCLVCIHRSKETFQGTHVMDRAVVIVTRSHVDFDRVEAPKDGEDIWEAALQSKLPHTTTHAAYKPRASELELRLSKEDQPPVEPFTPHHQSTGRPSDDPNVFDEMRKSIAIQESILSAMRASWHGTTEQEMYVQKQSSKYKSRASEYTFERDSDRFEEIE